MDKESVLLGQIFEPSAHTRAPHGPYVDRKKEELQVSRSQAFGQVSDLNAQIGSKEMELLLCLNRFPRELAAKSLPPKLLCYRAHYSSIGRAYRMASDQLARTQDREGRLIDEFLHPGKYTRGPQGSYAHNAKVTLLNLRIASKNELLPLMRTIQSRSLELQSCLKPRHRIDIGGAEDDMSAESEARRAGRPH